MPFCVVFAQSRQAPLEHPAARRGILRVLHKVTEHGVALLTPSSHVLTTDGAVVDQEDVSPIFPSGFTQDVGAPFSAGLLGPIPLPDAALAFHDVESTIR